MKTGLTKKQKVTEVYYNAKDPTAEIYTHDTALKKRLLSYAAKFPELCQQTDDDEQGGLRFEIDKRRISIRLTAPYSKERKVAASQLAKEKWNLQTSQIIPQEFSPATTCWQIAKPAEPVNGQDERASPAGDSLA